VTWRPRPDEVASRTTDVLVLGGGLSGHRAAVAAREAGRAVVHAWRAKGASPFIIGANVPLGHADPRDSPELFAEDMIAAGCGLNDRRLVEALTANALPSFFDLVGKGVPFARDGDRFRLRHLSGNTYPRSVYIPEGTGRVVIDHLARRANEIGVSTLSGLRAVALIAHDDRISGALLADPRTGTVVAVRAAVTILAMGGIGRLYADTTYPADVAADAYALALEAGATLIDMEFVQFEPVVTVWPEACRGMEMPTAMMGDGAGLLNAEGERFMFRHNPEHGEKRIEKARLSLFIQAEIEAGRGFPDGTVLFDTTTVPPDLLEGYVSHVKRLRQAGLEPLEAGPRVRPAAHSQMGGVFIDGVGRTGVPGLFACGEASGGVHGASRLAGNGGGETFAMGWHVGRSAAAEAGAAPADHPPGLDAALERFMDEGRLPEAPGEVVEEIRAAIAEAGGLYRHTRGLEAGLARIEAAAAGGGERQIASLGDALEARSLANMAQIARIILEAAEAREESRGAHQRRDFPKEDDAHWRHHIGFRLDGTGAIRREALAVH